MLVFITFLVMSNPVEDMSPEVEKAVESSSETAGSIELCSSSESRSKRTLDDNDNVQSEEFSDVAKKRPRGPYDCLDWDESDSDEFTPFTQSYSEESRFPPPATVFAKKSDPSPGCKGKASAKTVAKSSAKASAKSGAKSSAKSAAKTAVKASAKASAKTARKVSAKDAKKSRAVAKNWLDDDSEESGNAMDGDRSNSKGN